MSKVCLFAGYDKEGIIDDYVIAYLEELSLYCDVYYCADNELCESELNKLIPYTKGAWGVKHGKYDFGSYSLLASELVGWDVIDQYDEILLVNDSCYLINSLAHVFLKMDSLSCDWWGLQATKGISLTRKHKSNQFKQPVPIDFVKQHKLSEFEKLNTFDFLVGSYFVCIRKQVFTTDIFRKFLNNIQIEKHKTDVVKKYEIGLTRLLINSEFDFETYIDKLYPFHPVFSENHFELIKQGFPLLKKLLFTRNPYHVPHLLNWQERIKQLAPEADLSVIKNNLNRFGDQEVLYKNMRYKAKRPLFIVIPNYLSKPINKLKTIAMLFYKKYWTDYWGFKIKDKRIQKSDDLNVYVVNSKSMLLSNQTVAEYNKFKKSPNCINVILHRKKFIDLQGTNTILVPVNSAEGNKYLHKAGNIYLSEDISESVNVPLDPKLHNIIICKEF